MANKHLPLSLLDLAKVVSGATSAEALADTTKMAQEAEELGLSRFWVAEHHNMASVASTVPAVLIAHLAAHTDRIRLGSGGVMLPNHAPLAIAEQFAMLAALHPDRIDLGLGRAPGTDRMTAVALRRSTDGSEDESFPRDVIDLMGLLGDPRSDDGLWRHFVATPAATSFPSIVLLGSSDFSARLAGILGLPFGFAHHFDMGGTTAAVDAYRAAFEPSPALTEPLVIVTASAIAANSEEEATWLAAPQRLFKWHLRNGRRLTILGPEEALAHPDWDKAAAAQSNAAVGTPDQVAERLAQLVSTTEANELMLNIPTFSLQSRLESLRMTVAAWRDQK